MKYQVQVRRVVHEDTTITVEATSPANAVDLAIDAAMVRMPAAWESYTHDYLCREDDVIACPTKED